MERTDADRIKSVKEHFDALTSMTPADYEPEAEKSPKQEETSDEESDEEPMTLDAYDPDPGQVKKLRDDGAGKGKKRKGGDNSDPQAVKKPAFVQSTDYSQFSGGSAKPSAKEFNPLKKLQGNSKGGGQGKQRQRYKPGGKSTHFKRK